MQHSGMNDDGTCPDCNQHPAIGAWPFPCAGRGHILYMRLAFMPGGRSTEYAPPKPFNPIDRPEVTRDWMEADGTIRAMHPDEWVRDHMPVGEPGVKVKEG